jgi:glycosyltransferase involved in cell wall biosynthesis
MNACKHHITVCICTFKRPQLLLRTLEHLDGQETGDLFTYSVVVVDNDRTESARETVNGFSSKNRLDVRYYVEPRQNIALARNLAWRSAGGNFVAFIDDDEFPARDWLRNLLNTLWKYDVAGVLGPVVPHFDYETPQWVRRGKFFDRPRHATGYRVPFREARTGNVLLKRELVPPAEDPFRQEFGTGGEDVDFFRRMIEAGYGFVWCNEAIAFEVVPIARCKRAYLLRRALLRGANSIKNPRQRVKAMLKSLIAIPCYTLALPVLALVGQHLFLEYLIRLCDHVARLLAFAGLRLVTQREM